MALFVCGSQTTTVDFNFTAYIINFLDPHNFSSLFSSLSTLWNNNDDTIQIWPTALQNVAFCNGYPSSQIYVVIHNSIVGLASFWWQINTTWDYGTYTGISGTAAWFRTSNMSPGINIHFLKYCLNIFMQKYTIFTSGMLSFFHDLKQFPKKLKILQLEKWWKWNLCW